MTFSSPLSPVGQATSSSKQVRFDANGIVEAVSDVRRTIHVVREREGGRLGVALDGEALTRAVIATLPALYPEWLGDRAFLETHRVRFPYIAGAMANGIATAELVVAMARAGMLAFFGAAGLVPERIERALDAIEDAIGATGESYGVNLIHSPNEPALEAAACDLYVRRGVRRVSASAYVDLTPSIVRFAVSGLEEGRDGAVRRSRHVFAKISRPEVAKRFMSPAPTEILRALVRDGFITAREAALAERVPLAEDVTVEADSGGHTDNQALGAIFGVVARLRDAICTEHRYERPIRIGAAGGLGTPSAVASAFALGASYVLTGSVNQCACEAGLSDAGKTMLANAASSDVVMAPAADMFEQGVKVQVLRRGTMFASRAMRLYQLYTTHDSLESLDGATRDKLEREVFALSLDEVWSQTRAFFAARNPAEVERAERDGKHRMALVFRWYLGSSSRWAITGDPARTLDYQIWCGPAMGAFNDWARGSFLEDPKARGVVPIALNLLEGAAVLTRAQQLRSYGVAVPPAAFDFRPRPLSV